MFAPTNTSQRTRIETNLTNFCFFRTVITSCIPPTPYCGSAVLVPKAALHGLVGRQDSTASTLKRTCAKCSHASPIIPLTASRNCCHGTWQRNSPQDQAALHSQLQHVKTACESTLTEQLMSSTRISEILERVAPADKRGEKPRDGSSGVSCAGSIGVWFENYANVYIRHDIRCGEDPNLEKQVRVNLSEKFVRNLTIEMEFRERYANPIL